MAVTSQNSSGASGTNMSTAMLATVNAGDRLVCVNACGGGTPGAAPAGWTAKQSGAGNTMGIYEKIADGSEGGTNVTFTQSASGAWAAIVYRITGAHASQACEIGVKATGSTSTPDSPNLAPSWGTADVTWLAVCTNDAGGVVGWPSGYTSVASATGTPESAGAWKQSIASSENPGAFAMFSASNWVAQTIAIRMAPISPKGGTLLMVG